jgi:transposase InsO family protein
MVLQVLKTIILSGWPETRQEVPIVIRDYWTFREEMTVQNGVIFNRERIVIPKSMRQEMLKRIHSSHLGGESCLQKARDVLYWPNMSAEIKDMVEQCSTCNEYQQAQKKEPLMIHPIPECPWSRIAMDIFTLHGEDYLMTVDFYSDFWEVDRLGDITAATVIEHCKVHFSRHGVPDVVMTANGRQFDSRNFTSFAKDWEFEHTTSSPYHRQSNGKVEAAVKIPKRLMKNKAKRSGQARCVESYS